MKNTLKHIYKWEYFWLCLIILVSMALHFALINNIKGPIVDEVYYYGSHPGSANGDAYSIIHNHTDIRPEHPPLAKLMIAAGILTLGDNPVGWRTPSIIVGMIGIVLFYFICRKLNMSRSATNIATFLLAFENLTFLMSSVAMLDVFFVTLMLAFFLLYLHREYLPSGIFIGLASLAKLDAVMGAPTLFIHWIFTKTRQTRWFILTIIAAPVSLVLLLPVFDFIITRKLENPIARIREMVSLTDSLTFANTTHPALARPWEWLLNYRPMAFAYGPFYPNPSWLGGYSAAISPDIWIFIIPVVLYMIFRAVRHDDASLFGFAWFFSTYILWIPISILTGRISFSYYFYPTIGALCIGYGIGFSQALEWISNKTKKIKVAVISGISVFFAAHIASLIILTPMVLLFIKK